MKKKSRLWWIVGASGVLLVSVLISWRHTLLFSETNSQTGENHPDKWKNAPHSLDSADTSRREGNTAKVVSSEERLIAWLKKNPRWVPISLDRLEFKPDFAKDLGISATQEIALVQAWQKLCSRAAGITSPDAIAFDVDAGHATTIPADATRSYGVYFPSNPKAWVNTKEEFAESLRATIGQLGGDALLSRLRDALAVTTGSFGKHPWMARVWVIEPENAPRSFQFEMASGASILSLFVNVLPPELDPYRNEILAAASTAPPLNGMSFSSEVPAWLRGVVSFAERSPTELPTK